GILTQEVSPYVNSRYDNQYHSYIAASYVKFLEGAGARVVPIWIGQKRSYYEDIMSKVNGVLWPGGNANFDDKNGYRDAGFMIYKIAKEMYKQGTYFPIMGVCLGFELLTYVTANCIEHRIPCNATNLPLSLKFTRDYQNSTMFRNAPIDVIDTLKSEKVTFNVHHYCVTKKQLRKVGALNLLKVLAVNNDEGGQGFISAVESTSFPFYGLQFHPEKNLYEWILERNIPHGEDAVQIAQYFANFFVKEARKNKNAFNSISDEARSLIYNYPVTYTAQRNILFQQTYFFKKNSTELNYI
ncbi:Gamma-glutamyl hydrolase, partial [Dufourea novaeangliae]